MIFFILVTVTLVTLFVWRKTRLLAVLATAILVGSILYDNYITEAALPSSGYEVRSTSAARLGADPGDAWLPNPVYKVVVKLKDKHSKADIESARVQLELLDCRYPDTPASCSPIAREVKEFQFFAHPGQVKQAEEIFYLNNIVSPKGLLHTKVKVLDVTGDW